MVFFVFFPTEDLIHIVFASECLHLKTQDTNKLDLEIVMIYTRSEQIIKAAMFCAQKQIWCYTFP